MGFQKRYLTAEHAEIAEEPRTKAITTNDTKLHGGQIQNDEVSFVCLGVLRVDLRGHFVLAFLGVLGDLGG